jgi:hypothetical protein
MCELFGTNCHGLHGFRTPPYHCVSQAKADDAKFKAVGSAYVVLHETLLEPLPVSPLNLVLTGSPSQVPWSPAANILTRLIRRLTNSPGFQLCPSVTVMLDMSKLVATSAIRALLEHKPVWPDWLSAADRGKASQIISDARSKGRLPLCLSWLCVCVCVLACVSVCSVSVFVCV